LGYIQRFIDDCLRASVRFFNEGGGMSEPAILVQHEASRLQPMPAAGPARPARPEAIELLAFDNLDEVELEWRRFEATADCTPFQTFDWASAWCRHVGSRLRARPAVVVGRREDGQTLFLMPFAVLPGVVSRLTWLGSDLCDYNAPLLARDFPEVVPDDRFPRVWGEIRRLLQDLPQYRHDLIELTKLPEAVGSQPNPFLNLPTGLNPRNAYAADLPRSWDEFYELKRSSATRRRDRTKLKRLAEFGEVRLVEPAERFDLACTVEVLAEQKGRAFSRMGVDNMFVRPGWQEFYLDIATNPRTRELVHVSRLDVGPFWSAINLGLVHRESYYHILASYDDGEVSRFGPGVAHLRDLLRLAIERGLKRFDFTIGDERYKLEWSDHKLALHDHIAAATARGWPVAAAVTGRRRLKRLIKQNDTLWSLVGRARSAFGARPAATVGDDAVVKTVHGKSPPIAPE
jgi:CelD/BcsL family acetyltransferase involved in cellulose biosynthesis